MPGKWFKAMSKMEAKLQAQCPRHKSKKGGGEVSYVFTFGQASRTMAKQKQYYGRPLRPRRWYGVTQNIFAKGPSLSAMKGSCAGEWSSPSP